MAITGSATSSVGGGGGPRAVPLTTLAQSGRHTLALYGPSGSGKTTGAGSFCGDVRGDGTRTKGLVLAAEVGPEEGAGGLNALDYIERVHPYVTREDFPYVYRLPGWREIGEALADIRRHVRAIQTDGVGVIILDSGTQACRHLEQALTALDPSKLPKARDDEGGGMRESRGDIVRALVPNTRGLKTRDFEWGDYRVTNDHFEQLWRDLLELPFTLIVTYLEGDLYDPKNRKGPPVGVGPELAGRLLPAAVPAWSDAFFHCRYDQGGDGGTRRFTWLTQNDPRMQGGVGPWFAKHRLGTGLAQVEPASGKALLAKIRRTP